MQKGTALQGHILNMSWHDSTQSAGEAGEQLELADTEAENQVWRSVVSFLFFSVLPHAGLDLTPYGPLLSRRRSRSTRAARPSLRSPSPSPRKRSTSTRTRKSVPGRGNKPACSGPPPSFIFHQPILGSPLLSSPLSSIPLLHLLHSCISSRRCKACTCNAHSQKSQMWPTPLAPSRERCAPIKHRP